MKFIKNKFTLGLISSIAIFGMIGASSYSILSEKAISASAALTGSDSLAQSNFTATSGGFTTYYGKSWAFKKAGIMESTSLPTLDSLFAQGADTSAYSIDVSISSFMNCSGTPSKDQVIVSMLDGSGSELGSYEYNPTGRPSSYKEDTFTINCSGGAAESIQVEFLRDGSYGIIFDSIDLTYNLSEGIPAAESISVTPDDLTIKAGSIQAYEAAVLPVDASQDVVWSIEADPAGCATIDTDGNVTAVSEGMAMITATAADDSSITGEAMLTIEAGISVTGIEISPLEETIYDTDTLQFSGSISPAEAGQGIEWAVSGDATIDADGLLTPSLGGGTANVTATSVADDSFTATTSVTIVADSVTSLEYSGTPASQVVGKAFDATGLSFSAAWVNQGTENVAASEITFSPSVMEASTTSIEASYKGASVSIDVTVINMTSSMLDKASLGIGSSYSGAVTKTVDEIVYNYKGLGSFSGSTFQGNSSKDSFLANDESTPFGGLMSMSVDCDSSKISVYAGSSAEPTSNEITATSSGGKSVYTFAGEAYFNVVWEAFGPVTTGFNVEYAPFVDAAVESVTIDPTSVELSPGETQQFSATVLPSTLNDTSVTYSLEGTNVSEVASISASGLLTAEGPGEVTVVATANSDGSSNATASVTVIDDTPTALHVSGTPVTQIVGQAFNPEGLTFTCDMSSGSTGTEISVSSLSFNPSIIAAGTTEVVAFFTDHTSIEAIISGIIAVTLDTVTFNITSESGGEYDASELNAVLINSITDTANQITATACSKVYPGGSGMIKLGSGSGQGSVTFDLPKSYDKIEIIMKAYGSDDSGVTVNGANDTALTSSLQTYTFHIGGASELAISADKKSDCRFYIQQINLYEATYLAFANMILGELVCDPTGDSAPSTEEWEILELFYADLSSADQGLFKTAVGNEDGSLIEQAVAKYDYIVRKYGSDTYTNFMDRAIESASSNGIVNNSNDSSNAGIMAIALVSGIAVALAGAYTYLRKTKKN